MSETIEVITLNIEDNTIELKKDLTNSEESMQAFVGGEVASTPLGGRYYNIMVSYRKDAREEGLNPTLVTIDSLDELDNVICGEVFLSGHTDGKLRSLTDDEYLTLIAKIQQSRLQDNLMNTIEVFSIEI